MLLELRVRNYGLIDSLTAEFSAGLNVLSGETGVGKSMLVSALKFLLGARASSSIIREGEDETSVTGVFLLSRASATYVAEGLAGDGAEVPDELILRRSLSRNGRNRCSINDDPVTAGRLSLLARRLVDIHGQHEEQSLLASPNQRALLDRYGKAEDLRERYRSAYREWNETRRRHERLVEGRRRRQQELDLLRHQAEEIRSASPKAGEYDDLRRQQEMLAQMQDILKAAGSAQQEILEDEGAILERLAVLRKAMAPFSALHSDLEGSLKHIEEAEEHLREAARILTGFLSDQEYDPERLESIEGRLDCLTGLRLKYGKDEREILAFAEKAEEEIKRLTGEEEELSAGEARLEEIERKALSAGERLHERRISVSRRLSQAVVRELKALGMPKAHFDVSVEKVSALAEADESGMDGVEFGFCANPGEAVLPLADVASGGEVSRVFLAIKSILTGADPVPVLIFDEIDTNVGGRMGAVIGERLARLARNHQLVCVTHLPQIASYADRHIRVYKEVHGGRTRTLAQPLEGDMRLGEIAEMIRGNRATEVTLEEAREILAEARARRGVG
jgi:DNA repair protein RecN (Recombination protein N)